jgi:hypothetical protein
VVVEAERGGPLRAVRVSSIVGRAHSRLAEQESAEDTTRLTELLASSDVDTTLWPARRPAVYATRVAEIAARCPEILDRTTEVAELTAFVRSWNLYGQWVGPPWAGKTTLAAAFAHRPPPGVDVVSFFFSRTESQQTAQFWPAVADQLAALVGEAMPSYPDLAFPALWQRAAVQAALRDRRLVLVIDGLDENDEPPPVAPRLPSQLNAAACVLIFRRENPELPPEVPVTHPLRDKCMGFVLEPTRYSVGLEHRALQDLTALLMSADRIPRWVLGVVAAAGPIGIDDIAGVLRFDGKDVERHDVERVVSTGASARLLRPVARSGGRFALAHETLREHLTQQTSQAAWPAVLLRWAAGYAERGWPDDTPDYLVTGYADLVVRTESPDLAAKLASPERVALLDKRNVGDLAKDAEFAAAMDALGKEHALDLVGLCRVAAARYLLTAGQQDYPVDIAVGWAMAGQLDRAEYMVRNDLNSADRVRILISVAEAARVHGDYPRARRLTEWLELQWWDDGYSRELRARAAAGAVQARLPGLEAASVLAAAMRFAGEELGIKARIAAFDAVAAAAISVGDEDTAAAALTSAEQTLVEIFSAEDRRQWSIVLALTASRQWDQASDDRRLAATSLLDTALELTSMDALVDLGDPENGPLLEAVLTQGGDDSDVVEALRRLDERVRSDPEWPVIEVTRIRLKHPAAEYRAAAVDAALSYARQLEHPHLRARTLARIAQLLHEHQEPGDLAGILTDAQAAAREPDWLQIEVLGAESPHDSALRSLATTAARSAHWSTLLDAADRAGDTALSMVAVGAGLAGRWHHVDDALDRLRQPASLATLTALADAAAGSGEWERAARYASGHGWRPDSDLAAEAVGRADDRDAIDGLAEHYTIQPGDPRRAALLAAAIGGLAHRSPRAAIRALDTFDEPLHRAIALVRIATALIDTDDQAELRKAVMVAERIGIKEPQDPVTTRLWLDLGRIALRIGWESHCRRYCDQAGHSMRMSMVAPTREELAALARLAHDSGNDGKTRHLLWLATAASSDEDHSRIGQVLAHLRALRAGDLPLDAHDAHNIFLALHNTRGSERLRGALLAEAVPAAVSARLWDWGERLVALGDSPQSKLAVRIAAAESVLAFSGPEPRHRAAVWIAQALRLRVTPKLLALAARANPDIVPIAIPIFFDLRT